MGIAELTAFVQTIIQLKQAHDDLRGLFEDEFAELLADIGDVHAASYREAMAAASRGTYEYTDTISHLIDARNFYKRALERKRFGIFSQRSDKRGEYHEKIIQSTLLLALVFKSEGDRENFEYYREKTLSCFDEYAEAAVDNVRILLRAYSTAPGHEIENTVDEVRDEMESMRKELIRALE